MDEKKERLYIIQRISDHFNTSRLLNGDQILMGVQMPQLIAVVFDREGNYLKTMSRGIRHEIKLSRFGNFVLDYDAFTEEMEDWEEELDAKPDAIAVKRFFLSDLWIGIRDLPDHYQEEINHPESFDEAEHQYFADDLRKWYEYGLYVLSWGEEYYMTKEGNIDST